MNQRLTTLRHAARRLFTRRSVRFAFATVTIFLAIALAGLRAMAQTGVHTDALPNIVLELHPENAPPSNILLARLGSQRYEQKYSSQ